MEKPSLMKDNRKSSFANLLWVILLVGVVVFGGYLRTLGMDWDDGEYLHPDERFLTFVVSSIQPNDGPRDFFNTELSTMNPGNVGYRFYVYGTLPLFVNRFVSDFLSSSGLDMMLLGREATGWNMYLTGRYISAVLDTFTIVITFLIGMKLFKKMWAAVLAAGLYAFTALPIQLSHYFTVDIMANFFSMAAVYFAVLVMQGESFGKVIGEDDEGSFLRKLGKYTGRNWRDIIHFFLFGVSFGLAMACKISVLPIALLVVVAVLVRYFRLPQDERDYVIPLFIFGVVFAGIISFLAFRIGQPYAFTGPGFLHMVPDKAWIETLQNLEGQSKGLVDFPPALQWSRRPITFGFKNLTVWGLGLPLGIAAWAAFVLMSIQILRGKWKDHLLIWTITVIFFVWQSVNFTSSMRYYLQIYVTLAIIGAWGCMSLFGYFKAHKPKLLFLPIVITAIVFLGTLAYGFAFSRIYTRPATRVEASDWYYQNIPGPVNVIIETDDGEKQQVLPYEAGLRISSDLPAVWSFIAQDTTRVNQLNFDHIRQEYVNQPEYTGIEVLISSDIEGEDVVGYGELWGEFGWEQHQFGTQQAVNFQFPVDLVADQRYFLWVKPAGDDIHVRLSGVAKLLDSSIGVNGKSFIILPEFVEPITQQQPKLFTFQSMFEGEIIQIHIPHIVDTAGLDNDQVLEVKVFTGGRQVSASVICSFAPVTDARGEEYVFVFEPGILVNRGDSVEIEFSFGGEGGVALYGSKQANESSWDDVVPLRRQGYDPFYEVSGVYRTNLNFEMYWNDDESKRERFLTIIDQADIIMMTSNRQWGTTTRVPERYPMTTMYYRELIGCPPEKEVFWCYAVAEPGMFEGNLGFRLKEVFQSNPNIGSIAFNTQFAEEAFTVYDHPKVLVFEKTDDYDRAKVADLFYAVDLNNVVHMIPADVPLRPKNLLLPSGRLAGQRSGGTWADLYPPQSLLNQSPLAAAVVWYLAIALLGVISYPITRIVFSGLHAKGYAVSRMVGLVLFAWLSWVAGSAGIPLTRLAVWLILVAYAAMNGWLFVCNRTLIIDEIKQHRQDIFRIEIIGLAFFLAFLLVRVGNPDLWHPYKGGEKPMDFAYLNAVLKSTTFPPYDPWFAGGYINYYYYGFVIVGMPIKALGINPAIAYNLVLASLFSIMGLIAYVIGATVTSELFVHQNRDKTSTAVRNLPLVGGLITAIFSLVIGNLGTVQMIFRGLTRLGAGEVGMGFGHQFMALVKGFSKLVSGQRMPFYPGDWYWIPSRMIPGEPITEFPYFTFLYADLHAHLLAMPITLLVVAWCLSLLKNRLRWNGKFNWANMVITIGVGAVIVGSLRPTNTWDLPVFLVLAMLSLGYSLLKHLNLRFTKETPIVDGKAKKILLSILLVSGFAILAILFYEPFSYWYGAGYTSVKPWQGDHTPIGSYVMHWGIFLTLILVWFGHETIQWLASVPVSALRQLILYRVWLYVGVALAVFVLVGLLVAGVSIIVIALPLAIWAGLLLLRKQQSDVKKFLYFITGTALFLTIAVEVIVLEGDIGRMNTVFKFYLQAWNLFAIAAAAGLTWFISWLIPAEENRASDSILLTVFSVLLVSGLLFPILASHDKITDRMAEDAPHTIDGSAYMEYAEFNDQGVVYSLAEDAATIQWLQENVEGSPVIMEGHAPEYRWGSRFSINTGLPAVVGWNWHQRQQKGYMETNAVQRRVDDVNLFYTTTDLTTIRQLMLRYGFGYIIVGELERVNYPEDGLRKFVEYDGELWASVFSVGNTTVYKVLE